MTVNGKSSSGKVNIFLFGSLSCSVLVNEQEYNADCFLTKPTVPESRPEKMKDYWQGVQKLVVSLATAYCGSMHLEDENVAYHFSTGRRNSENQWRICWKTPPFFQFVL